MATKKAKKAGALRNLKAKKAKAVRGGKGKASPGDFQFTHLYDKSSPVL